MQVSGGRLLSVDTDDISTGLGEISHTEFGLHDHEMAIEDLVGDGAESIHNQGTDGDVGHEAAIHNINVNPVATGLVNGLDLQIFPEIQFDVSDGELIDLQPL